MYLSFKKVPLGEKKKYLNQPFFTVSTYSTYLKILHEKKKKKQTHTGLTRIQKLCLCQNNICVTKIMGELLKYFIHHHWQTAFKKYQEHYTVMESDVCGEQSDSTF